MELKDQRVLKASLALQDLLARLAHQVQLLEQQDLVTAI